MSSSKLCELIMCCSVNATVKWVVVDVVDTSLEPLPVGSMVVPLGERKPNGQRTNFRHPRKVVGNEILVFDRPGGFAFHVRKEHVENEVRSRSAQLDGSVWVQDGIFTFSDPVGGFLRFICGQCFATLRALHSGLQPG